MTLVKGIRRRGLIIGPILIGLGALMLYFRSQDDRFDQEGVQTEGVVANEPLWSETRGWGPLRGTSYFVSYSYRDDDGQQHFAYRKGVTEECWKRCSPGEKLRIVYLANDPATSRPVDAQDYPGENVIAPVLKPLVTYGAIVVGCLILACSMFPAALPFCLDCAGSGTVEVPLAKNQGTLVVACETCHGSGKGATWWGSWGGRRTK